MKLPARVDASQVRTRLAARKALGMRTETTRIGLRRDLDVAFTPPSAKIPIEVRQLANGDAKGLFGASISGETKEQLEVIWRKDYLQNHSERGWVAVDLRSGLPCYVQWLLGRSDNAFIKHLGAFPELGPGEALLENAFTPSAYRGLGIMAAAMARIAEHGTELDARYVFTFVSHDNIASLKGCVRAGFAPHLLHHHMQAFFGLRDQNTFEPLADGDRRGQLPF